VHMQWGGIVARIDAVHGIKSISAWDGYSGHTSAGDVMKQ